MFLWTIAAIDFIEQRSHYLKTRIPESMHSCFPLYILSCFQDLGLILCGLMARLATQHFLSLLAPPSVTVTNKTPQRIPGIGGIYMFS